MIRDSPHHTFKFPGKNAIDGNNSYIVCGSLTKKKGMTEGPFSFVGVRCLLVTIDVGSDLGDMIAVMVASVVGFHCSLKCGVNHTIALLCG
eukprot:COSAG01_NODE_15142_length_1369_cov_4.401907_1_plen_91_part_00